MSFAIQIHETGGPEVMRWEPMSVVDPEPGQVRLRQTAVGLNYIDVYFRTGLYPLPQMPGVLGMEAAGVVEALGAEVQDLSVGDRVAYAATPPGAYAQERNMPAEQLVKLPDDISDETAAAMMLRGMTAHYLIRRIHAVKPGDTVLIHAAAGGVGLIVCQWAKHLGATVIGTVGSAEKAALAAAHGCDHPIHYQEEDFVARVRELTGGKGVDVVYDSVGDATFMGSLDCLRSRGMMVSFGNASGAVKPFAPGLLAQKGGLFLTRPSLFHYISTREELEWAARDLFEVVQQGVVKIEIGQRYALKDVAKAHADLEARRTTGSTVLIP
ncbi:NADPH2:quinone reductase [Ectothiorhodosinus mongolicus]|uniref:NADPH:quinone reductase n=1 Tax=Ectothiorhodosinus mongolicus TaxID=233100 RepID=A0A1R3VMU1_9GAMM|nr:quinone oxidoreductase [Ectothiorhodosinus mongolicus]ULX56288.1 quinone oxidoreductase [Ectothiorhodosinus mongolicus]SIT65794.1 NADPH2:quinone reductase [Ectothiorhodosinus mongolicus]